MTNVADDDLSGLEARSDPVFAALAALGAAREAHAAALRELEGAVFASGEVVSRAMVAWRLYQLSDLEAAEAAAAAALHAAKKAVLKTRPTTGAGSVEVLALVQSYLAEDPDIDLAIHAISNVTAVLSRLT